VQSKEKLTYMGTLLNVMVSKDVVGIRALGVVLNTTPMNINNAVKRHRMIKMFGSLQWALLDRKNDYMSLKNQQSLVLLTMEQ
jgi:hypothetical protein